jgi:hypothetical protein
MGDGTTRSSVQSKACPGDAEALVRFRISRLFNLEFGSRVLLFPISGAVLVLRHVLPVPQG